MSVIVKDENSKITLFCKGADNKIIERSQPNMLGGNSVTQLEENILELAKQGLRTLCLAYK